MKSLPTLIKVAQRRIDDVARLIAEQQSVLDGLQTARALAEARMSSETAVSASDVNLMSVLPAYTARYKADLARIDDDIAKIEKEMDRLREQMIEAYGEKSRMESLEKTYAERARKEAADREQAALDEAAITRRVR